LKDLQFGLRRGRGGKGRWEGSSFIFQRSCQRGKKKKSTGATGERTFVTPFDQDWKRIARSQLVAGGTEKEGGRVGLFNLVCHKGRKGGTGLERETANVKHQPKSTAGGKTIAIFLIARQERGKKPKTLEERLVVEGFLQRGSPKQPPTHRRVCREKRECLGRKSRRTLYRRKKGKERKVVIAG